MTSRNILTLCGLLIIAVGSWYLASTSREDEITKTVTDTRFGGYYLRSARILGTDDNGLLLYEIKAEYAEQQENNEIRLQNVHISYSTGAEVPWSVSADVAMVSDSLDVLRLSGHVGFLPSLDCYVDELPSELQARYRPLGLERAQEPE